MRNQHPDPTELAIVAALLTLQALRVPLVALVALALTLAGYRPSTAPAEAPAPIKPTVASQPTPEPLAALPVRELRLLARTAGHRQLARSGRKADLLAALA